MSDVEVEFSALTAHIRTARLVATAVARHSGVEEHLLDEVRIAVGEACSRAVEAHRRHCPEQSVRLQLRCDGGWFEAVVVDCAPASEVDESVAGSSRVDAAAFPGRSHDEPQPDAPGQPQPDGLPGLLPPGIGLAVVTALVSDVDVSTSGDGVRVRMGWPAKGQEGG